MKIWITLNEPWVVAVSVIIIPRIVITRIIITKTVITRQICALVQVLGHGTGEHAPGDVGIGTLVYQVSTEFNIF